MENRKMSHHHNLKQIPGSVIYTGTKKTAESLVNMIQYTEIEAKSSKIEDFNQCMEFFPGATRWIDFVGVDQTNDLQEIGEVFTIHPLILEDIANIQQRPKIEEMGEQMFVSLKMFAYRDHDLYEEQISLLLGKDYVISFQENEQSDDFSEIKDRILQSKGRIRKMKSDYLLYSLIDSIVDQYFLVLENIGDDIEDLQDELVNEPTPSTLPKIQMLKQKLITVRKSIWPVREILNTLQRTESDLIDDNLSPYLRDVYDHTVQIIDTIETFREILSGSLDIYLSGLSNKMNQVMKVLTVISTIFIPLTFLVGVYGMNFEHMPELDKTRTYPTLWGIMIATALGMLWFFRKKKWL